MKRNIFALLCLVFALTTEAGNGVKPQWVQKGEQSLNDKRSTDAYEFKIVVSQGRSLADLKDNRLNTLADYVGKQNQITGKAVSEAVNEQTGGNINERETFRMVFQNDYRTDVFYATLVDDYWEQAKDGEYTYWALFAVSSKADPSTFDRFSTTTSYGAAPIAMSIIPGVGQFYKGQTTKGIALMGGAAVSAGALIFCESHRAAYMSLARSQPQHARTYKTKADNYAIGRNVAVGVTAALCIYSVVDAAVSPGVRKIKVTPTSTLSFHPLHLTVPDVCAPTFVPDSYALGPSLALFF